MFGLWRMGGGDRNLGETGHRGDSRKCSMEVGDLTGGPTFELKSDPDGRRVGVLAEDKVLFAGTGAGLFCLASREGLISWKLPFLERIPALADEARELAVRDKGLVGEGSRDVSGDGAADDEVDVLEVCDTSLEGAESVFWVIVAVLALAEDSRDGVGCAVWLVLGASDERADMFGDLSMSACALWYWLEGDNGDEGETDTCHAESNRFAGG